MSETIVSLFLSAAEKYQDNPAFHYFDQSWKTITYRDLLRYVYGVAAHLIQSGLQPGDRAAIISENRFEWCASYLGILTAGGTAVPIDAQLSPAEVDNLVRDSEARCIFCSDRTAAKAGDDLTKIRFDSPAFHELCNSPRLKDIPAISQEDIASIVYTSGTTGIPKGVVLTHRNFCSDAAALIHAGIVSHEDNVLSILPLHHTYAFMCTFLVPVFAGATITYPVGMKGPELMSAMQEKGVTVLVAVPQLLELIRNGIVRKLNEMPAFVSGILRLLLRVSGMVRRGTGLNMGRFIFKSAHKKFGERFRFFASGGARLDPKVMEDLEALGFAVLEGYGLTETAPVVTFNPFDRRKAGSAGRPLPSVEIKVMNPSATGEGEIAIRGPMVMQGYYKHPEATEQVIRDGWFMSGDLGYLDGEGYLFLTGRIKEVIVLGSGKNVYPDEVEKEYLRVPLIKELCVTGIEEQGIVEALHGVIVPDLEYAKKEGIGNIHETMKWELNRISVTLPPYMRLKGFSLHPEPLPRTPLGKLKRFMIRESLHKADIKGRRTKGGETVSLDEVGRAVFACITPLLKEEMDISLSDNLELDLGLDSLQRIELVVAIEKAFSIKLPENLASEVQTVGELVSRIKAFESQGIAEGVTTSRWKELFAVEPSDEEKQKVGLKQHGLSLILGIISLRLVRVVLTLLFRLGVKGVDNIPKAPFILAPNHCSNMDGLVVAAVIPGSVFRVLYFQGFQKYFQGLVPSFFARQYHIIPIDTEAYLSSAFQISAYVLKNRRALCIFPEGGRTIDGNLLEFKKGVGILSLEHAIPVVPVLIEGTFEVLPRGARWPKFRKITVSFGKPLHPSEIDYSRKPAGMDNYQFFANEVRERVEGLRRSRNNS